MEKISVIIPCYNVESFIDNCLTSVMSQTIGINRLEVICIDDASTDRTWEQLLTWEQLYPENIVLIRQKINQRQGAARNIGLRYSSSQWVTFVDADDWLEPDYLEQLHAPVLQFDCDIVVCGLGIEHSAFPNYFDQDQRCREEDRYIVVDTIDKTRELFGHKLLGPGPFAKLLRKELLLKHQIFFPEGLAYEDNFWNPLLYIYAKKVYLIGKNLYHHFLNPNSTVRSLNAEYHMDWVTVQLIKWRDYATRGLYEPYQDILEGDALQDAAGFVKMLILRYNHPSFSLFMLESELIRQQVPDYRNNLYAAHFPEIARLFLEALYSPMDQETFLNMAQQAKKYYGQV